MRLRNRRGLKTCCNTGRAGVSTKHRHLHLHIFQQYFGFTTVKVSVPIGRRPLRTQQQQQSQHLTQTLQSMLASLEWVATTVAGLQGRWVRLSNCESCGELCTTGTSSSSVIVWTRLERKKKRLLIVMVLEMVFGLLLFPTTRQSRCRPARENPAASFLRPPFRPPCSAANGYGPNPETDIETCPPCAAIVIISAVVGNVPAKYLPVRSPPPSSASFPSSTATENAGDTSS